MPRSIVPPGFNEPMLPTLVDTAPDGEAWVHEIKYDGYRTQLAIAGKNSRAFTRNGHDWTDKYGIVIAAAKALKCRSAVIDGEMCVQNAQGVTDFKALRAAVGRSPERLVLFAFDILALNGRDLREEPLLDRRRRLQDLIGLDPTSRLQFSAEQLGQGPAFFAAADHHGLEGIVSKRADSRYVSGRAKTWLKVKSFTIGDYAVLGVERSSTGIPIALLATLGHDPSYVGNAMVTLPAKEREGVLVIRRDHGRTAGTACWLCEEPEGDLDPRGAGGARPAPAGRGQAAARHPAVAQGRPADRGRSGRPARRGRITYPVTSVA